MKKKSAGKKPSLQQIILNALADLKAQDVVVLDVSGMSDVMDTMVIASGSSNRQVRALAEHAVEEAKKEGYRTIGQEGFDTGEWVLADFGDIVLHVMQPETRTFYDLERLWQAEQTTVTPSTAKPATKTRARKATAGESAIVEPEIETQGAKARARKAPPKPAKAPAAKAAGKGSTAKAGVYAKTGTRKPAAKKTAATAKPASAKPAATKSASAKPAAKKATSTKAAGKTGTRAAVGISSASKPKATAGRKPRSS